MLGQVKGVMVRSVEALVIVGVHRPVVARPIVEVVFVGVGVAGGTDWVGVLVGTVEDAAAKTDSCAAGFASEMFEATVGSVAGCGGRVVSVCPEARGVVRWGTVVADKGRNRHRALQVETRGARSCVAIVAPDC